MRSVEALRERNMRILGGRFLGVGDLLARQLITRGNLTLTAFADLIEREVTADENEPGGRIARRPLHWPGFQRAQTAFLECVLGGGEVTEISQQRAHDLRADRGQRRADGGQIAAQSETLGVWPRALIGSPAGLSTATGLISIPPVGFSRASRLTASIASSRLAHSRR